MFHSAVHRKQNSFLRKESFGQNPFEEPGIEEKKKHNSKTPLIDAEIPLTRTNNFPVQRKAQSTDDLSISQPEDASEKEADAIAKKVSFGETVDLGKGMNNFPVQRKSEGSGFTMPKGFGDQLATAKTNGFPVQEKYRGGLEQQMQKGFGDVRIHDDPQADALSSSINAKAFTHGQDIFFKQGEYRPETKDGKELLAHELVHTGQQSEMVQPMIQRSSVPPNYALIAMSIRNELNDYSFLFGAIYLDIDEDVIIEELNKLGKNETYIETFKEYYRVMYATPVEAELRDKLESSERWGEIIQALTPGEDTGVTVVEGQKTYDNIQFTKATDFLSLIKLIKIAEDKLIHAGFSYYDDRVKILRGIYYGTEWSMDYSKENSEARNLGFDVYTASTSRPDDPRHILGDSLFMALRNSPEVKDGNRRVDVGHLIIGLEARTKRIARELPLPYQGGSGLEAVTWLGDLGGGVGMLAMRRTENTSVRAKSIAYQAEGNDYGARVNLEGDIASYVVAMDPEEDDDPSPPNVGAYTYVADAIADYLLPQNGQNSSAWTGRVKAFAKMIGAEFDASNNISNKTDFVADLKSKLMDFGSMYALIRLNSKGNLTDTKALSTSKHIDGAAKEVAEIFADILEKCAKNNAHELVADLDPAPSPAGEPTGLLADFAESAQRAKDIKNTLKEWLE